ncbi:hypothetical protein [Chryseobacterium sp.]|uniref:hypothetical protein n=1 Tax=Chryseobacterium sp. TaxID=1871047 RepID=UPI0011C7A9CF|nr:hypothetical protein [Chryseobacterium sp.]TXF76206.1 hypothetical protein FUA25_09970 [Chryseobacterium sp.]
MKKLILTLMVIAFGFYSSAQSVLQTEIDKNIPAMINAQTTTDFDIIFNNISKLRGNNREIYYYSALALMKKIQILQAENKLSLGEGDNYIAEKYALSSYNIGSTAIETEILLGFIHLERLLLNPKNAAAEKAIIDSYIEKAKKLDRNHPRLLLLQGEVAYFIPENLGGDKQKAIEFFQASVKSFKANKKQALGWNWGQSDAENYLNRHLNAITSNQIH